MSKAQRIKAQSARERIAAQQAAARRAEVRRRWLMAGGAAVVVIAVVIGVVIFATHKNSPTASTASRQVVPPGVGGGPPTVQAAAHQVPNTSGIAGVTEYVTTGWPTNSNNGPASEALAHDHVNGPVTYSVMPPVGGPHNATWMNCGVYTQPVPSERAVHNLEHGAVWITYQPSLPSAEVSALRAFVARQSIISPGGASRSRYMDLTPYSGLPSPIVLSSWGNQLKVSSPSDPRLQEFVNKFRASPVYSPEFGAPCTGGVGTPAQT